MAGIGISEVINRNLGAAQDYESQYVDQLVARKRQDALLAQKQAREDEKQHRANQILGAQYGVSPDSKNILLEVANQRQKEIKMKRAKALFELTDDPSVVISALGESSLGGGQDGAFKKMMETKKTVGSSIGRDLDNIAGLLNAGNIKEAKSIINKFRVNPTYKSWLRRPENRETLNSFERQTKEGSSFQQRRSTEFTMAKDLLGFAPIPHADLTVEQLKQIEEKLPEVAQIRAKAQAEAKKKYTPVQNIRDYVNPNTLAKYPAGTTMEVLERDGAVQVSETQQKNLAQLSVIEPIIAEVDRLSEKLMTAKTTAQAWRQSAGGRLAPILKNNPDAEKYKSMIDGFSAKLAKVLGGESGVLSNQDNERIKSAFPTFGDLKEVRDFKMRMLEDMYKTAREAHMQVLRGHLSPGQGREFVAKKFDAISGVSNVVRKTTDQPPSLEEFVQYAISKGLTKEQAELRYNNKYGRR